MTVPADTAIVRRNVAALAAAVLPPEAGGPPPDDVARAAATLLAAMPATTVAGVAGAGLALRAAARVVHGSALTALPHERRAALLAAIERRSSTGAAVVDALKAVLLLAWGGEQHAAEIGATATAAAPARPDADLTVVDGTALAARLSCDAIVVGSGAGGAFAARELARAGRDVIVVEEGERWDVARIRATGPVARFAGLYREGGSTIALGRPSVALPVGRAVGGTTVVNSGTCYRPPATIARAWHEQHGLALAEPGALDERLTEIEALLGIGPVPLDVMGVNGRLALQGAAALDWEAGPLRRNAPGCRGACQCALGCPNNAKAGVHLTALPQACAAGARIAQRLKVRRVLTDGDRATGIEARDAADRCVRIDAPLVVVSAGATETPPLLRRSGLGGHPRLGRGLSIHPSLGVVGSFDEPVHAWRGVLQSAGVEEFHEREGILIEATSTPPGMGSMILPGVGAPLLRALEGSAHVATIGGMVADHDPAGRVLGASRSQVVYRLARADGRRLVRTAEIMARVLLAAGAREVLLGGGAPPVRSARELDAAIGAMRVARLHLAAFHPTGSCAGGADPARHPADAHGRLRGVRGVVVADGSLLPSCASVNPQLSIMAIAGAAAAAAA